MPLPATPGTGVAYFDSLSDAGRTVSRILVNGSLPATMEFLDRRCINAVEDYAHLGLARDAGAPLLFGDDGKPEAVAAAINRMGEACVGGARDVTLPRDIAESDQLLGARRCCVPALARLAPVTMLEDVAVPRPHLATMVDAIDEIAACLEVVCATFGHAGDGNLHPTIVFDPSDSDARKRAEQAFAAVFNAAVELGGTITREHGVGAQRP